MKTYKLYFNLLIGLLLSLTFAMTSCDDDDDDGDVNPTLDLVTLQEVTLNGAQEVPANNSQATGTFKGTFNRETKVISYNITFQGITPIGMHFHRGEVGVAGPIVIPINPGAGSDPYSNTNTFRSPLNGTTPALTAAQETDLLAGNWFLNIHSNDFPDGEIRAQLIPMN